jgi:hypothetical protein
MYPNGAAETALIPSRKFVPTNLKHEVRIDGGTRGATAND